MMVRKRAPGAGRKPQGAITGLTSAINLRMPEDLRDLINDACRWSGRSLTQEVLGRLYDSFERERDPAASSLGYILRRVTSSASTAFGQSNWRSSPFVWRAIQIAFGKLMDRYAPSGRIEKLNQGDARRVFGFTPEELAATIATSIMLDLESDPELKALLTESKSDEANGE
jgi:hypothetical protein